VTPELESRLAALEAAESNEVPKTEEPSGQPEIAPQAEQTETKEGESSAGSQPDTSAVVETPQTETKPDNRSAYAKSNDRLEKTWKAVNERKAQLDTTESSIKQREEALQRSEQSFNERQAAARAKGASPEQYEQASQQKETNAAGLVEQAEAWDAKAEKLDDDGNFKEAEKARSKAQEMREQAAEEKALGRLYKSNAENIRKNPDQSVQQLQAKREKELQYYTLEAAKKWPDVAKNGSDFQKAMLGHIQAAKQVGIDEVEFPAIRFFAARLTAAETSSANVSELTDKLNKAEARVKDLEKFTSPGGGTTAAQRPTSAGTMTEAEEYASLRKESETYQVR
jgi:uncharacterized protein (DUF3084 family)